LQTGISGYAEARRFPLVRFFIFGDADAKRYGEHVYEKVTKLVLVDCIVHLVLLFDHISASGVVQLSSFERRSFADVVVSTKLF